MSLGVIIFYGSTTLSTIVLMTILTRYLQEMPLERQCIRHLILKDLACLTTSFCLLISISIVARNVIGPFQVPVLLEMVSSAKKLDRFLYFMNVLTFQSRHSKYWLILDCGDCTSDYVHGAIQLLSGVYFNDPISVTINPKS
jgi:hypothetical protein